MCCWTNNLITLTLDEVCEVPLAEACLALDLDDAPMTMVILNLDGEIGGTMILMFSDADARQLADSLLHRSPSENAAWDDMEKSALSETGNILGCAYMNAITRLIDRQLMPSAPYFVQDYGASVLQQALAAQASGRDAVLVCRTGFHSHNENLRWRVLFMPTAALRMAMENAMQSAS
jgi:chemotaxis protein CheC